MLRVAGRIKHWVIALIVVVLVAAGVVYYVAGPSSRGPALPGMPGYHVMPEPAHRTVITVRFASAPEHAGRSAGGSRRPAVPPAPFRQCRPVGADRGCEDLIQITDSGYVIVADPGEGPYDGSAATSVGVLNSSSGTVSSLTISADSGVFAFDGDGICSRPFRPAGGHCPFGPTGYEGPGTGFTGISADGHSGTVTFGAPLAPGKHLYFSLAQALAAGQVAGGGPSVREQGGAPNLAERQAACAQQEPVNCATGYLWQQFTDFSVPGRGVPLDLTRTYVSGDASADSPFGYGWTDSYAMSLQPGPGGDETIVQEDGAAVTFSPDGTGGYTAPPRVLAALTDNGDGTFTFSRNASTQAYVFSASSGLLLRESDLDGDTTKLAYRGNRLTAVTDPAGRPLRFTYTGPYITSVTDPMGKLRTRRFGYQAGNLVWARDALGRTWRFGYGPGHLLEWMEDPRGYVTHIRYDASGRVSSLAEPGSGTIRWSYTGNAAAPQGGTTTQRGPGQAVTTYDYAALELLAVTDGTGTRDAATTGYTYSPDGLVSSVTDPDLHVTAYAYDRFGNLSSVTNPLRETTRYQYNGRLGEITRTVIPGEPATRAWYDSRGNLIKSMDGAGNITLYGYGNPADSYHPGDPEHRSDLISVTGPAHQVTRYTYDHFGDVESFVLSPAPGQTSTTLYAYDADGELTCEVPADSQAQGVTCPAAGVAHVAGTLTYGYDLDGELRVATGASGGPPTITYYDKDGNLIKVVDPDKNVTTYSYSPGDEQTRETVNGATVTAATYDDNGNMLTQTDGPYDLTRYTYDVLGRLTAVTDPLHRTTSYGYDRTGNLTSITDPSGLVTRYAYNAAAELIEVTYGKGSPAVAYSYYPDGELLSMTDGTGVTRYTYDGDNRLTSAVHTSLAGAVSAYRYGYDDAANSTTLTYPDGGRVTDSYDGAGLLTSVRDWLGHTTSFSYDAEGNLTAEKFPGGVTATNSGTTITVTNGGGTLARFSDTANNDGQLTSATTAGLPGIPATPVTYTYSTLGQLRSGGTAQYQYDPAGDPSLLAGITQTFNAAGELQQASGPDGKPTGYTYDKQGNLTAATPEGGTPVRLTYNQAGQLTGYRTAGSTASYSYAGDGLRSSKTVNGTTTGYTWDQAQATPLLLAAAGTSYIYGPDGQPIEQITGTTPTYLLADQQGNTRLLTSETGTVAGTYTYTPYGTTRHHTGESTALQYDGQYTDGESGYIYLRARYYDPATAQFLTPDPDAAQTLSPYGYADDDPLNASDPTGLSWNPISLITSILSFAASGVTAFIGVGAAVISAVAGAADFVREHWRGLVKAALYVGYGALGLACLVGTVGICDSFLIGLAISVVVNGAAYLVSAGPKSWSGAIENIAGNTALDQVSGYGAKGVKKIFFPDE
jgi:RHS repeat-associated protein